MDEPHHCLPRALKQFVISAVVVIAVISICVLRRRNRTRDNPQRQLHRGLPELIDQLMVLLRAGYTPANAFRHLEPWLTEPMQHVVGEVNMMVQRGVRFSSAIAHLRHHIGPPSYAIVDALIQLDRDGLAATTVLDRLSGEAHAERKRRADTEARELPLRLIFPMVCCVLPSFAMLTVVPMMAGTLLSLGTHMG